MSYSANVEANLSIYPILVYRHTYILYYTSPGALLLDIIYNRPPFQIRTLKSSLADILYCLAESID